MILIEMSRFFMPYPLNAKNMPYTKNLLFASVWFSFPYKKLYVPAFKVFPVDIILPQTMNFTGYQAGSRFIYKAAIKRHPHLYHLLTMPIIFCAAVTAVLRAEATTETPLPEGITCTAKYRPSH